MKNEEIKNMTKEDLEKLKKYLELIDPKNTVFNETKKIIDVTTNYNNNNNIQELDKLLKNLDTNEIKK